MEQHLLDEMEGSTPTSRDLSKNSFQDISRTDDFPEYQLISEEKCEVLNTKSNADNLSQKQAYATNPPLCQRSFGEATKKAIGPIFL